MKKRGARVRHVCLTVLLLTGILVVFAGAASAGAGVEIRFPGGGVVGYDGSPQRPAVRVIKDGIELLSEDYTVDYKNNKNAGIGTAMVEVKAADGSWTETSSFTIRPRELTAQELSFDGLCVKVYDGTNKAEPNLKAEVLGGDLVSVNCNATFDSKFVGSSKEVTARELSLTGPDRGNYTLPDGVVLTGHGQITAQTMEITSFVQLKAGGQSLDLNTLVTGATDVQYSFETDSLGSTLSDSMLTTGKESGTVQIFAQAADRDINGDGVPEYYGGSGTVQVSILSTGGTTGGGNTGEETNGGGTEGLPGVGLIDQPDLVLRGGTSVTYGQTLSFSVSGGAGAGKVSYTVIRNMAGAGDGSITSGGLFTPTRTGKVRIQAVKAGDNTYRERRSDAMEVIIRPAQVTVTVRNQSAVIGDQVPRLTAADYTVSGLVGGDKLAREPTLSYASTPDMTKSGFHSILATGGVVPNDNYAPDIIYRSGMLTIAPQPIYGIQVIGPENGTLHVDRSSAEPGARVTIQVKPNEGYELKNIRVVTAEGASVAVTETGEGRYIFTMPDHEVTVSAVFQESKPPLVFPFTDVKEGDWFYGNVVYVYQKGLMTGTSDTAFSPDQTTTRGMIVTILYRMEGSPAAPARNPFADVAQGKYYADPVAWAAWNGIVNGTSATAFEPESPIAREQMAAILYRYAQFKGYPVSARGDLSQFTDRDRVHAYALDALSWANAQGLITGKGKGRLDPRGPATRAEVAAILQRFCEGNGL